MAKMLYFSRDAQLDPASIHYQGRDLFGSPIGENDMFTLHSKKVYQKVTRKVQYKAFASKHACDRRCMYATGRTMQCECSCGGKNHGKMVCN